MPSLIATADAQLPLAILISGGLDSAVLLGESQDRHPAVYPLYVRVGSTWETDELDHLQQFLAALTAPAVQPLVILDQPVADLYGAHWSLTGINVPDSTSPDEAVYLPGRNVLLLAKALLWCHLHHVPQLALATLAANPFPDAAPDFFRAFQQVVNQGVHGQLCILAPYLGLTKTAVIQRGRQLPLEHTFSCIAPRSGRHCGACNKCAERQHAFRIASVPDPTHYFQEPPCSA